MNVQVLKTDGVHNQEGFLGGPAVKRICLQCRRQKRRGFDSWVGKIPWRKAWYSCLENPMDRGA